MQRYSPDQLLEAAQASPAAVARHDGAAWVALFARHGVIEDPVGSRPHHGGQHDCRSGVRGSAPLRRFYDTFIAPNEITFRVLYDVVAGPLVVRDLAIGLDMGGGLAVDVPMHVIYEITEEDGALKIAHLRAHWELVPMVAQVLGKGWPGVAAMTRLGLRMIATQGLGGVLGFCRGIFGVHGAGKRILRRFVDAADGRNPAALTALFDGENDGIVFPDGPALDPAAFCERLGGPFSITKVISCGWVTSCSFHVRSREAEITGVGFFEFNSRTRKLHAVRLLGTG